MKRRLISVTLATVVLAMPAWAWAVQGQATQQHGSNLATLIWWLVFFGFIAVLLAGLGNKVVIFYNTADLALTFAPWISFVVCGGMLLTLNPGTLATIVRWVGLFFMAAFTIAVIANSVKYNKSLLIGLVVGPFKLIFALVGIVALVNLFEKGFSEKASYKDLTVAGIIFGITGWIAKKLINGEQVYIATGWALPESGEVG